MAAPAGLNPMPSTAEAAVLQAKAKYFSLSALKTELLKGIMPPENVLEFACGDELLPFS